MSPSAVLYAVAASALNVPALKGVLVFCAVSQAFWAASPIRVRSIFRPMTVLL